MMNPRAVLARQCRRGAPHRRRRLRRRVVGRDRHGGGKHGSTGPRAARWRAVATARCGREAPYWTSAAPSRARPGRQHSHGDHPAGRGAVAPAAGGERSAPDQVAGQLQAPGRAVAAGCPSRDTRNRCRDAPPAVQAQRSVHQRASPESIRAALQPVARQFNVLQQPAASRRGWPAWGRPGAVRPSRSTRCRRQVHLEAVLRQASAVADRLQRQPFHARAGVEAEAGCLQRLFAVPSDRSVSLPAS
jgi:hypothetical protein